MMLYIFKIFSSLYDCINLIKLSTHWETVMSAQDMHENSSVGLQYTRAYVHRSLDYCPQHAVMSPVSLYRRILVWSFSLFLL